MPGPSTLQKVELYPLPCKCEPAVAVEVVVVDMLVTPDPDRHRDHLLALFLGSRAQEEDHCHIGRNLKLPVEEAVC